MALEIKGLARIFHFKKNGQDIDLPDPDIEMSPDMVMNFYTNQFTELTTATVSGPIIENDKLIYSFTTTIGTKG